MIEFLRGTLARNEQGRVVIEAGGVGYGVEVPTTTVVGLPGLGEETELHIYLYFNDQALRLYGFASRGERDLFEVFLGTAGIGPKTALGIMSSLPIADFARAILGDDIKTLTKIPGVGRKTAERMIIELRDKIKHYAASAPDSETRGAAAAGIAVLEAIKGLETLGCKAPVAQRAVHTASAILGPGATASELLREALKHRG